MVRSTGGWLKLCHCAEVLRGSEEGELYRRGGFAAAGQRGITSLHVDGNCRLFSRGDLRGDIAIFLELDHAVHTSS